MSTSIITNRINKLKELLVEFGTVKNDIKSAISNKLSVQAGEPVEAGRNMSYWVEFINSLEVSQYSDMAGMCYSFSTITEFPEGWKFAPRTENHAEQMFSYCSYLTTIPQLDTSKGRDFGSMFYDCAKLTTLGGFVGLGKNLDLSYSPNLTHDSLMNVINNLATVTSSTTLTLGSTNLAKLTDEEKKVATDKGWTLA